MSVSALRAQVAIEYAHTPAPPGLTHIRTASGNTIADRILSLPPTCLWVCLTRKEGVAGSIDCEEPVDCVD